MAEEKSDKRTTDASAAPLVPPRSHHHWWFIGIFAAMIIIAGAVYLLVGGREGDDGPLVLQIGTQKLTQQEYARLSQDAAVFQLLGVDFNGLLIDKMTEIECYRKIGVTVTDQAISQADRQLYGEGEMPEAIQETASYESNTWRQLDSEWYALNEEMRNRVEGDYQGAILFFYFGNYQIMPADGLEFSAFDETISPELFGDANAIKADRDYAYEQATAYRQKIEEDPEKLNEYIEIVNGDSRINGYATSKLFGYDELRWSDGLYNYHQDIRAYISSLRESGVSDMQVIKLRADVNDPENAETVEAVYWFVYLDDDPVAGAPELTDAFIEQRLSIQESMIINVLGDE